MNAKYGFIYRVCSAHSCKGGALPFAQRSGAASLSPSWGRPWEQPAPLNRRLRSGDKPFKRPIIRAMWRASTWLSARTARPVSHRQESDSWVSRVWGLNNRLSTCEVFGCFTASFLFFHLKRWGSRCLRYIYIESFYMKRSLTSLVICSAVLVSKSEILSI